VKRIEWTIVATCAYIVIGSVAPVAPATRLREA
jgi:hypothetical protein